MDGRFYTLLGSGDYNSPLFFMLPTPILESNGYDELSYDIVKTGRKLWISVYITFDRDDISISRFHHFQTVIIKSLSESFQDFYFELLPDIEYCGRTEVDLPD